MYELGPTPRKIALDASCEQPGGFRPRFRLSADGAHVVRENRPRESEVSSRITALLVCRLPRLDVVGEFPHTSSVQFDFTSDGSFLATLESGTLRVWDTRDGALRFSNRPARSRNLPTDVMFSSDGRYVATSDFRVFEVPTGQVAGVMPGPAGGGFLAIGNGTHVLAGNRYRATVHAWSFQAIHRTAGLAFTRIGEVRASLSPGNRLFAASRAYLKERALTVWDLSSGNVILSRSLPLRQLRVAFLSDAELAVLQQPTDDGHDIEIIGLTTGKPPRRVKSGFRLQDIGFLEPHGLLGLDSGAEGNRLIEIRSGKAVDTWPGDKDDECEFAQGPRSLVCFGTTSGLRIFGLGQGRIPHSGDLRAMAISPDQRILFADIDKQGTRVYEARTKRTLFQLAGPAGNVLFSDDTRFVAVSSGGALRIWSLSSGTEIVHARLPSGAVPLGVSSKYLIVEMPERMQLWLWPYAALKTATCRLLTQNRALPVWRDLIPNDQFLVACPETISRQ